MSICYKKYKKGDLICFYDCEERNINSINDFVYSIVNPFNKKIYIGYNELNNENGTGQFINDYHMFELNYEDRDENGLYKLSSVIINNKIREYEHMSQTYQNVEFKRDDTNLLNIYALKEINENDELYLHYGIEYWISKIQLTTDEPLTRLYCLLKNKVIYINKKNIYVDGSLISPEQAFRILKISPTGNIVKHLKLEKYTNLVKLKRIFDMLN